MRAAEAKARGQAATERIRKADPVTFVLCMLFIFAWSCGRAIVHLCIAFGSVSMSGISLWWGIPLALVSAQTLGRVWSMIRRGTRVKGLENLATVVEANAAKESK